MTDTDLLAWGLPIAAGLSVLFGVLPHILAIRSKKQRSLRSISRSPYGRDDQPISWE